ALRALDKPVPRAAWAAGIAAARISGRMQAFERAIAALRALDKPVPRAAWAAGIAAARISGRMQAFER
ncbi:bifunctional folylpolyglutamate synthase/dihydrofolate synthase, partial [Stenotrophomonas maltophilia]